MLRGGLEISRPLIVVWLLPTLGALLVMFATRSAQLRTQRAVLISVRFLLLAYLAGAVILTLWPLEFDLSIRGLEEGNWSPFGGSLGFLISDNTLQNEIGGRDVLANVVLFAPFGVLLPLAVRYWRGVGVAILMIALLALGLEVIQGATVAERTFDMDDAIAGFAGGALATVVALIVHPFTSHSG